MKKLFDIKGMWILGSVLLIFIACSQKKVPLDQQQFIALLIDMHVADGTLAQTKGYSAENEKKNYAYYNSVFRKYGIDRAEFDSCMRYYSAQTALFSKLYDVVIDSLNKRLTDKNRVLNELRSRDSVNYFPRLDTIVLDTAHPVFTIVVDSLQAGLYRFATTIKFDTLDKGKNNRITAFFLTPDDKDTLHVREIKVLSDTLQHLYNWSQYIDSSYNRLVVKMVDTDKSKKQHFRKGRIWGTTLYRPYISSKTEQRLNKSAVRPERAIIEERASEFRRNIELTTEQTAVTEAEQEAVPIQKNTETKQTPKKK
ncbi:hypothetical protein CE91St19_23360 [Odoribacter laneus]|jgi:hypothetical protein|uniref:DUF4296 domain-containing protein n=1 Tax=Odoribacter laneus YIT 12061 TaxID=742817 RepID=H1DL67_9BACT|nr:DUF4296 domain-containing protein [Odoribacter laneus]EHP45158.1 hypothetical protein HMPREF9449_03003 [Odoribacter laneus YIT 12061]MBS1445860.1 DUF4296 domain-containing protein [Odoribacter sp.]GKI22934.1 hypothetical protein CE91St19_23360 [Odoribacter laneus]GKI26725.1 hypothetical protein CE91St20_28620 [Odoribacter laneus]